VTIDAPYFRPAEVETLLSESSKARKVLGWEPKVSFSQLVEEMIQTDYDAAQRDDLVRRHGYSVPDAHE
jgi:GDPmannose 4,6-dehydratase